MIRIGTSGWDYDHWRGPFYPDDVADTLAYYTRHFSTVEINNTFYQLPDEQTVRAWRETVPADFVFAVKASRYLTHMKKLIDPQEPLHTFIGRVDKLEDRLGPLLFQLPGNWHFNAQRLEAFLWILPEGYRYAFEFRDPSWHTARAYDLLARYNAAFCIFDYAGTVSAKATPADYVYIRRMGPARRLTKGCTTARRSPVGQGRSAPGPARARTSTAILITTSLGMHPKTR
jgi:uncharacterized protein YecE (DUF72 family)